MTKPTPSYIIGVEFLHILYCDWGALMKQAVIYMRTSTLQNVGEGKDSGVRQEKTCREYAKSNRYSVKKIFYDKGVSGSISVYKRDAFLELYMYCIENEIRHIIVEKLDRFSRDVLTQEIALKQINREGFHLISASNGDVDDTTESKLIRQIMGAVSEYEASAIATRLQVAKERKAKQNKQNGITTINGNGKCGGRPSYAEINPELVKEAKRLRRVNPKTKRVRSYDKVAEELHEMGYTNQLGNKFNATTIKNICVQKVK